MNGKSPTLLGAIAVTLTAAMMLAASGSALARDAKRQRGAESSTPRARATTVTNAQGETATRDLTVTRDKKTDTVTRAANYSTFDGRNGARSDVIQRTDDGYSRDTTRTTPAGATHTRSVDVSCDKDAGKCIKQVETGQQP